MQVQDLNGNYRIVKKRIWDPLEPTYVRVPLAPLTRSWVKQIADLKADEGGSAFNVRSLVGVNLADLVGSGFQVVYMNPPIGTSISIDQFVCVCSNQGITSDSLGDKSWLSIYLDREGADSADT